jgi:predicted chitinase
MNKDEVSMMYIQDYKKIVDVQLQEISKESVIKKIYNGGLFGLEDREKHFEWTNGKRPD